jgi:hypothetical protein
VAWVTATFLLFPIEVGDYISKNALAIPIAIGLFFGFALRSGVAIYFRLGKVTTWAHGASSETVDVLKPALGTRSQDSASIAFETVAEREIVRSAPREIQDLALAELRPFYEVLIAEWDQWRRNPVTSRTEPEYSI